MIEKLQANAILLANQLNLSIFQQLWLVENEILSKDEFGLEAFFSPMAVSVRNDLFDFLVIPDRVQVTAKEIDKAGPIFERILSGIVKALPHTPYTALGFNFQAILATESRDRLEAISRHLCLRDDNPLATEFTDSNARFGIYLSKEGLGMRLGVDIKPAVDIDKREVLQVNFNFHRDIKSATEVFDLLPKWHEAQGYVRSLSDKLDNFIGKI